MNATTRIYSAMVLAAALSHAAAGVESPQPREPDPGPIERFVRQIYIEGVPYDEASRFDANVVPRLLEMLADPADEPYRVNIVVVLGSIGDERAVEPMIAQIEKPAEGRLSDQNYLVRSAALISLGYLVHRSGNTRALNYLKDSLDPSVWDSRGFAWLAPYHASREERDRDLSRDAVLGLAVSGHPEAAEALRAMAEPAPTESARRFRAEVEDVVAEALEIHDQVAREGLLAYYRRQP